jgi:hypothetical protein
MTQRNADDSVADPGIKGALSRLATRRALLAATATGAAGLAVGHEATEGPASPGTVIQPVNTDWINAVTHHGADNTGAADATSSINAALAAVPHGGGTVYLPAGTYAISAPLSIATSGTALVAASPGATTLRLSSGAAGFPKGSAAIQVTNASSVSIAGLAITGPGPSYGSSPAADGIVISNSPRCTVRDCFMTYLNGYAVIARAMDTTAPAQPATSGSLWSYLANVHAFQCAGGARVTGAAQSGNNAGTVIESCVFEQIASGDALLIEDAHDVQVSNLEAWNLASSSGSSIHIKGDSAAVALMNVDVGGLTGTAPQGRPAVLIEAGSGGDGQRVPRGISMTNGIIECGTPGLLVMAGEQITISGVQFFKNANHGLEVSGPADVLAMGCVFSGNGYAAAPRNFDAVISASSGATRISNCEFMTPAGHGSGEVTRAINGNGLTFVENCRFTGAPAFGDGDGGGNPKLARNNIGYNPVGHVTSPPVPQSGTSLTNPFGQDCLVCVTGGTVTSVALNGVSTGLKGGAFHLPWGQAITLNYSSAPEWAWFAE